MPVLDSFEKAFEGKSEAEAFRKGIDLVRKQFLEVMDRHGLSPISALGEPFDPNWHQALSRAESETHKPDTIKEEFVKGYRLHDRLLRPSMVAVAIEAKKKASDSQ